MRPGTIADLIRRYRNSRFYIEKESSTRRGYDQNLKIIEQWAGQDRVKDIEPTVVQDLYENFRQRF